MEHWLDEFPALRTIQKSIAAENYNRIRLLMLREPLPWHVPLSGFPGLLGVLEETAWICIDQCQGSLPILAWTNFKTARSALDAPVECELRLYHIKAGLVMGTALDALAAAVAEYGRPHSGECRPVTRLTRSS